MLALALFSLPVSKVGAVSGANLQVSPASIGGIPGGPPSTVSVQVANVTNIVAYDVTLSWDPSKLACVGVSDTGTIFSGLPHAGLVLTCGLGFARAAETLLGGSVNVTGSSSAPLLFVTLAFTGFTTQAGTPLTIGDDTLVDSALNSIPHTNVNGIAKTPPQAQADLVHFKARPDFHHLSISARGNVNTLFADVAETSGLHQAYVEVIFTVVSSGGDVSTAVTPVTLLAAGQESVLSATWTAPSTLPFRYFVVAQLQVGGDGILFIPGNSKTFSFTVVP